MERPTVEQVSHALCNHENLEVEGKTVVSHVGTERYIALDFLRQFTDIEVKEILASCC